jgi:uncharacterized protein
MEQANYMQDLRAKANDQGDVAAIKTLLGIYHYGWKNIPVDYTQAYHWYYKAHRAGSNTSTAKIGEFLVAGLGVPQDVRKGFLFVNLAAGRGCEDAARFMADVLLEGTYGFAVDVDEAVRFLRLALERGSRMAPDVLQATQRKLANAILQKRSAHKLSSDHKLAAYPDQSPSKAY